MFLKNRFSGAVIFNGDYDSIKLMVLSALAKDINLRGAGLREADLSKADLSEVNLRWANLSGADLSRANLRRANLSEADLRGAYLSRANLREADLSGADLSEAYLRGADLREANLRGANLLEADLRGADLRGANLSRADLGQATTDDETMFPFYQKIPEEGAFIGWKSLQGRIIAKLEIPSEARRTSSIIGRKNRAEFVKVLSLSGDALCGVSVYDNNVRYTPGEIVRPDSYNGDPKLECAHGIHFFITRQEAEEYAD